MTAEKSDNPHRGSSLDAFLRDEGIHAEATTAALKRVIAWQLREAMRDQKLSKVAMAARMGAPRSQLDRVLNPEDGNVTIDTLQRAAKAVGRSVRFELV
jgi:DNA-binding phage protein